jgi:hypothetical protein
LQGLNLTAQLLSDPFGLFSTPPLFGQLLLQRGLRPFGDLQADTKLCGAGGLLNQAVGKFADSATATLCGNIRSFLLSAVGSRR